MLQTIIQSNAKEISSQLPAVESDVIDFVERNNESGYKLFNDPHDARFLNNFDKIAMESTINATITASDRYCDNQIVNKQNMADEMSSFKNTSAEDNLRVIAAACYGQQQFYLNEMHIDRGEEEQTIRELVRETNNGLLMRGDQNNSIRIAFGILLRLVLPLAYGVVRGIKGIRDVRFLTALKSIASSRQSLTNLMAFAANTISMNLSVVQVSHRIEPILKLIKLRKSDIESIPASPTISEENNSSSSSCSSSLPTTPTPTPYLSFFREPNGSAMPSLPTTTSKRKFTASESASKCCTLNVLAEPPPGTPIRADIVFIHGLHGSLVNTWKQGLWENERRPVEFERPPKPAVRPPKRPRYTRSATIRPPHRQKRARFTHSETFRQSIDKDTHDELDDKQTNRCIDFSYICEEPKDIKIFDGIEYSFPTFRLRLNDNGRLIQPDIDTQHSSEAISPDGAKKTEKVSSPDDPNYSKCWPGDWLPLDCPGVRVIAVNYTTDQYLWRPLWKPKEPRTNLIQRAREMEELLIEKRVGYGHPVVWVGHSKGGLFVKQIIVDAWESGRPAMAPFWRSSRGCFFYSVPHRGSNLASVKAPLLTRSVELIDIEKNSKYLIDLHRRFAGLYHMGHLKIEVFSFVETALTLMSVLYLRIVGADSADPGIGDVCGIRLDHREICKPRSRECILYKRLADMINKVC